MRLLQALTILGLAACASAAEPKRHEYELGKVPKSVKVKVGDEVVVTHKVNPRDVEEITSKSDNDDVKVTGKSLKDGVRITVRATKKGKAQVGWEIHHVNGQGKATVEMEIEFE